MERSSLLPRARNEIADYRFISLGRNCVAIQSAIIVANWLLLSSNIFVLRTNTELNPLETMLCYKQMWTVEQTFRTAKHLLASRPIFHKLDETIRGHLFRNFLALVLKKALEDRIATLDRAGSWPEIIADLDLLTRPRSFRILILLLIRHFRLKSKIRI
jgi:transposase